MHVVVLLQVAQDFFGVLVEPRAEREDDVLVKRGSHAYPQDRGNRSVGRRSASAE